MYIKHGRSLVEHHTHYKELHGYDKTVLMTRSEHTHLHQRLRHEENCNVPADELKRISNAAQERNHRGRKKSYNKHYRRYKHLFCMTIEGGTIQLQTYTNTKTDYVGVHTSFGCRGGV